MFRHIIVPTDGSRLSRKVVKPAIALARKHKARLSALLVVPVHFGLALDTQTRKRPRAAAVAEGNAYLDEIRAAARTGGVKCDPMLLAEDQPWRAIVAGARRRGCDLIMMAAHGRHGLAALVLGSETNRVLVNSKIRVLVYR